MNMPSRSLEAPTELPLTLTLTQVADVLNLRFQRGEKKGRPNRLLALELVATGRLRVIDPELHTAHWAVSRAEIERYMNPGQRHLSIVATAAS